MSEVARILKEEHGLMYGRNTIFKKLRQANILNLKNLPYQQYMSGGYFKVIRAKRGGFETSMTLVRAKGIRFIRDILLTIGKEMHRNSRKLPRPGNQKAALPLV
jgi:phage antirepressor YoqD-like protein